jgi:hypothetical protein
MFQSCQYSEVHSSVHCVKEPVTTCLHLLNWPQEAVWFSPEYGCFQAVRQMAAEVERSSDYSDCWPSRDLHCSQTPRQKEDHDQNSSAWPIRWPASALCGTGTWSKAPKKVGGTDQENVLLHIAKHLYYCTHCHPRTWRNKFYRLPMPVLSNDQLLLLWK